MIFDNPSADLPFIIIRIILMVTGIVLYTPTEKINGLSCP
jgi:hypothetical protein